jgi:hypothetical protein
MITLDRPDVVIQNGSMMNIHENKQLILTCSYDCLPSMVKIVWFMINDKGNFITRLEHGIWSILALNCN